MITIRLSAISFAGTARTEVAVGTSSDEVMFFTTTAADAAQRGGGQPVALGVLRRARAALAALAATMSSGVAVVVGRAGRLPSAARCRWIPCRRRGPVRSTACAVGTARVARRAAGRRVGLRLPWRGGRRRADRWAAAVELRWRVGAGHGGCRRSLCGCGGRRRWRRRSAGSAAAAAWRGGAVGRRRRRWPRHRRRGLRSPTAGGRRAVLGRSRSGCSPIRCRRRSRARSGPRSPDRRGTAGTSPRRTSRWDRIRARC